EVAALDGDPVEVEIGKAGIARARRVAGGEAGGARGSAAGILNPLRPAQQREARPGERVRMLTGAVEQQRHLWVGNEVPGVLGEIGQEQQRARMGFAGGPATEE